MKSQSEKFTEATEALREAKRILKPNGLIIISSVLPAIIKYAIWYSQIHEGLTERFIKIMPSAEQFEVMFQSADLKCVQKTNVLGHQILSDYYNAEGPLDETWRKPSSYWTYATEDEMDFIKKFVKNMKDKGELDKWVKEHDHVNTSGFLTVYMCKS